MTRISDAMRAAADRAPVANVHITTASATSRVRRHRALRGGANGLVGAGAVAILVAGVVGSGGLAKDGRVSGAGAPAVGAPEPGFATDNGGGVSTPDLARACGYSLAADSRGSDISITADPAATTIDPGAPLAATVTAVAGTAGDYSLGQTTAYVLWNGLVVSEVQADTAVASTSAAGFGVTSITDASMTLANCWDGSPLPAGTYTVIMAQDFYTAGGPSPLPTPTIAPEQPGSPSLEPTVAPDTSVGSDGSTVKPGETGSGSGGSADGTVSSGTATSGTAVSPPVDVSVTRAYAEPFDLTISGDAVKDPFGAYLGTVTQPTLPDGVVTPDEARAAYKAGETSLRWNMAAGTQRVVMTASGPTANGNEWQRSYYGCPTDGTSGTFPGSSAVVDWLDVSASIPSSVHVSYGWIVDGNPKVAMTVTNTSPWTLPGFYGQPNATMYLVKDGRVVAEAYPVSPDRSRGGVPVMETGVVGMDKGAIDPGVMFAPGGDGYLDAGASLKGDYLWRDVNGCWNNNGASDLTPGTYTVLTMQDIYVGGGIMYTMGGASGANYGATDAGAAPAPGAEGDSTSKVAITTTMQPNPVVGPVPPDTPVTTIAPAPDQQDYASFQVWTSLGTVTVTG